MELVYETNMQQLRKTVAERSHTAFAITPKRDGLLYSPVSTPREEMGASKAVEANHWTSHGSASPWSLRSGSPVSERGHAHDDPPAAATAAAAAAAAPHRGNKGEMRGRPGSRRSGGSVRSGGSRSRSTARPTAGLRRAQSRDKQRKEKMSVSEAEQFFKTELEWKRSLAEVGARCCAATPLVCRHISRCAAPQKADKARQQREQEMSAAAVPVKNPREVDPDSMYRSEVEWKKRREERWVALLPSRPPALSPCWWRAPL
jgi:hypothetical protein